MHPSALEYLHQVHFVTESKIYVWLKFFSANFRIIFLSRFLWRVFRAAMMHWNSIWTTQTKKYQLILLWEIKVGKSLFVSCIFFRKKIYDFFRSNVGYGTGFEPSSANGWWSWYCDECWPRRTKRLEKLA